MRVNPKLLVLELHIRHFSTMAGINIDKVPCGYTIAFPTFHGDTMQIDMHYYGTYALARAAGLQAEAAKVIATAAQYVDDNTSDGVLILTDGARIPHLATAHDFDIQ